MKDRRSFLKDVCPTVAFAFFGISFLEACSSGSDDDVAITPPDNGSGSGTGSGSGNGSGTGTGGSTNTNGYTQNGNTYTIDLTHSNFSALASTGGWMNGQSIGIPALFLRISNTVVQGYTNVCPRHGRNNEWVLENSNTFRCDHQQNRFSTDCSKSDSLKCYTSTLEGDKLTLVIS